jgi:hypothetical protein
MPVITASNEAVMGESTSISRRAFLGGTVLSSLGTLFQPAFADQLRKSDKRAILIWMSGGASQFETWDPKPGKSTAGPHGTIPTSVTGVRFDEHLPRLARLAKEMAVVRSMTTSSNEHSQATIAGLTGLPAGRSPEPPNWLSVCAHELVGDDAVWPAFVALGTPDMLGQQPVGGGFLGPRYDPLTCPGDGKPPTGLPTTDTDATTVRNRGTLRDRLEADFAYGFDERRLAAHKNAFRQLDGLLDRRSLFDLSREPLKRSAVYGDSPLGRDCLLACRLVERGVPFVLVSSPRLEWDLHRDLAKKQQLVNRTFDTAIGAMIDDLVARGLWKHTLLVLMGEFGRSPSYSSGRDHWSKSWSMSFGGAGVKGGVVVGSTDADGRGIKDRPVTLSDLLTTFYEALGVDPFKDVDVQGRPVPYVERGSGKPIHEVL